MKAKICPNCESEDIAFVTISSSQYLMCNECGFDESEDILDVHESGRNTQKGKTGNSPYKRGGSQRTRKL